MNSTHHELSFELLHVEWHFDLEIFDFSLMSGTALSLTSLTQQLAVVPCRLSGEWRHGHNGADSPCIMSECKIEPV